MEKKQKQDPRELAKQLGATNRNQLKNILEEEKGTSQKVTVNVENKSEAEKLEEEINEIKNSLEEVIFEELNEKLKDFLGKNSKDNVVACKDIRKKVDELQYDDKGESILNEKSITEEYLKKLKNIITTANKLNSSDWDKYLEKAKKIDSNDKLIAKKIKAKLKRAGFSNEDSEEFVQLSDADRSDLLKLGGKKLKEAFVKKIAESKKYEVKLEDTEKKEALKFFRESILPSYSFKRDGENWSGYSKAVAEEMEREFLGMAVKSNVLDKNAKKIELAWEEIAKGLEAEINRIEAEIVSKKSNNDNYRDKYYKEMAEESREKRRSLGEAEIERIEKEIAIISAEIEANKGALKRAIRQKTKDKISEIIKLHEEKKKKLEMEVEEIKRNIYGENKQEAEVNNTEKKSNEEYIAEYQKGMIENDKEKKSQEKLAQLEAEVEKARKEYVAKENEVAGKLSQIKRFLKNFVSLDKNYEINKELDEVKKNYEDALKNYLDMKVDVENPAGNDKLRDLMKYVQITEKLNLINAKEDLKMEKNPKMESFLRFFKFGSTGFLDKYSKLLSAPKNWITQKTGSNIKGLAGGAIAVGGVMAFASSYIPGLRSVTIPLSILVATYGFQKRANEAGRIEEEKSLDKNYEDLMTRLKQVDDDLKNKILKTELGLAMQNIPEKVIKETEEKYNRLLGSFGKAIVISGAFYGAGKFLQGYFAGETTPQTVEPKSENPFLESHQHDSDEAVFSKDKPEANVGSSSSPDVKPQTKSIFETMEEIGIKSNSVPESNLASASDLESSTTELKSAEGPVAEIKKESIVINNSAGNPVNVSSEKVAVEDLGVTRAGGPVGVGSAIPAMEASGANVVETPAVEQGIKGAQEIVPNKEAVLNVEKGSNVKDSLAKFLEINRDKFTEGKMGWDPEKFNSLKDWAENRAIGIVGEFTEGKDQNYNLVSPETTVRIDFSNPADIQIEEIKDPLELGKKESATVSPKETAPAVESTEKLTSAKDAIEEIKSAEAKANVAAQELELAYRTGIAPDHYAEINDVSVKEFIEETKRLDSITHGGGEDSLTTAESSLPASDWDGTDNRENMRLGRILESLQESGKLEDGNQNIQEALRNVSKVDYLSAVSDYEANYGDTENVSAGNLTNENWYGEYTTSMIQEELKEMMKSSSGEGNVMKKLTEIRGSSMRVVADNELLNSFKEVTTATVGNVEHGKDETVGRYVLKAIRKAYETGTLDAFKEKIATIKITS